MSSILSVSDFAAGLEWSYFGTDEALNYVKIAVGYPVPEKGYPIWLEGDSSNCYWVPTGVMTQFLNITPTPFLVDIKSVKLSYNYEYY